MMITRNQEEVRRWANSCKAPLIFQAYTHKTYTHTGLSWLQQVMSGSDCIQGSIYSSALHLEEVLLKKKNEGIALKLIIFFNSRCGLIFPFKLCSLILIGQWTESERAWCAGAAARSDSDSNPWPLQNSTKSTCYTVYLVSHCGSLLVIVKYELHNTVDWRAVEEVHWSDTCTESAWEWLLSLYESPKCQSTALIFFCLYFTIYSVVTVLAQKCDLISLFF